MAKSIYSCEQIWQGKIITSADRDQFKLSKDDFRTLFLEDPKYQSRIDSFTETSLGNGMFLFDVKYKVSPTIMHIVYQDLRSGDRDDHNEKRFQLCNVAINPNEPYCYIGGYNTGDNALLVSILNHVHDINSGFTPSPSSLWIDWDKIKDIYNNNADMWNQDFRSGTINLTLLGCRKSAYSFLHIALISRSLGH